MKTDPNNTTESEDPTVSSWLWEYTADGWKRLPESVYNSLFGERGVVGNDDNDYQLRTGKQWSVVQVWENEEAEYRWVVEYGVSHVCTVLIRNDLSLFVRFLNEAGPLLELGLHDTLYRSIDQFLEKAFQAWHGHDLDSFCESCDPDEWKDLVRRRRERAARKAAEQSRQQRGRQDNQDI